MERLQQQVQGIGTKTKTPHLTTGKGVQTDKAKSPQGNQLQVMEKEEDDKRGEFEESDDELDDSRDDRTKESGKSSRIELLFIQEKEKLEKGLLSRLESVTEEKQSLHQQIWVLSQYHEKVKELSKKLRASEQHLKKRIETCRILEQDLQTAQDKSNELGATVKTLTQENGRSKSQNQADSNRITFLEERRRELEYDLKEKATQLQQQKQFRGQTQTQVETQLRAEIERKTQETKELTVKMEKQEEDVRNVQQLAIRIVGKPQHSILSDSEIREEFESEKASMKEWAKKWVVPELTRSKSEYESSALPKELQKVVLVGTPPKQSIKDLLKQVKPRIAVHALLAQFFAERIFQQCFLPLHEAAKLSPATSFSASMTRLLELFIRKDPVEAHAWRAQTLQLLAASSPLTRTTDEALASDFLEGASKLLLQTQTTAQKQELTAMITSAREFSVNIWKRRTALEIRGLDYYQRKPYRGDSEEMEAHRVHRLEEGGRERDGSTVRMVVQPGFFARGDEDGTGFERAKVWGKAMVLLE